MSRRAINAKGSATPLLGLKRTQVGGERDDIARLHGPYHLAHRCHGFPMTGATPDIPQLAGEVTRHLTRDAGNHANTVKVRPMAGRTGGSLRGSGMNKSVTALNAAFRNIRDDSGIRIANVHAVFILGQFNNPFTDRLQPSAGGTVEPVVRVNVGARHAVGLHDPYPRPRWREK